MSAFCIQSTLILLIGIQYSHQLEATIFPAPARLEEASPVSPRTYKTLQANSTLLKLLMDPNKDDNTKSKIFDMLHSKVDTLHSKDDTLPRIYRTLRANSTLLKLLMDPNKDDNTKSEIFDMLHSKDSGELPIFPEDVEVAKVEVPQSPNMQSELLQASGEFVARDDASSSSSKRRSRQHAGHAHEAGGARGEAYRGALAGIMVGVTCSVVLLAYVSLVVWKRHDIIKNGGKHELLRNEENPNEARIEL